LPEDAKPEELVSIRNPHSLLENRTTFEGCAAIVHYHCELQPSIALLPIDLQLDAQARLRGQPQLADRELGGSIIRQVAAQSRKFGTQIDYDAENNRGVVLFPDLQLTTGSVKSV
jgi:hypothetical protein